MPTYVPNPDEFKLVINAVTNYTPRDFARQPWRNRRELPIRQLLDDFDQLVAGNQPEGIKWTEIPHNLLANPRSLALALALAIMRPNWDRKNPPLLDIQVGQALGEFTQMQQRLCDAWIANPHHDAEQKIQKTLDEVVAFGTQQRDGWDLANDVVFCHVLDGCLDAAEFLEGPPKGDGLIPDLSRDWGGQSFEEEARQLHATKLMSWLQSPVVRSLWAKNAFFLFTASVAACYIAPGFEEVPPGSKRSFKLEAGVARLLGPKGFDETVTPGQRLILRSFDEGEGEFEMAVPGHAGGAPGPTLQIDSQHEPWGRLLFEQQGSVLEAWSCRCGRSSCNKHHRISAWDPRDQAISPPDASLRTFLLTAVKGTGRTINQFAESMYYALLCGGV